MFFHSLLFSQGLGTRLVFTSPATVYTHTFFHHSFLPLILTFHLGCNFFQKERPPIFATVRVAKSNVKSMEIDAHTMLNRVGLTNEGQASLLPLQDGSKHHNTLLFDGPLNFITSECISVTICHCVGRSVLLVVTATAH